MTKLEVQAKVEESKTVIQAELVKMSDAVAAMDETPASPEVEELKKKIDELTQVVADKDAALAAAVVAFDLDEQADAETLSAEKAKTEEALTKLTLKNEAIDAAIQKLNEAKA